MQNKRTGAAVALGWGQHMLLLDVPLARHYEDPAAGMPTYPLMFTSKYLLLTLSADPSLDGGRLVTDCIWHFYTGMLASVTGECGIDSILLQCVMQHWSLGPFEGSCSKFCWFMLMGVRAALQMAK